MERQRVRAMERERNREKERKKRGGIREDASEGGGIYGTREGREIYTNRNIERLSVPLNLLTVSTKDQITLSSYTLHLSGMHVHKTANPYVLEVGQVNVGNVERESTSK